MLRLRHQQIGDTIIEVMFALLIVSLVLSVAYATAGRSLYGAQESQERTVASQIAQSNIEVIKTYAERAAINPSLAAKLFPASDRDICFDTRITAVDASTPPVDYHDAICDNDIYRTKVSVHPLPPAPLESYEYTVTVNWETLVGTPGGSVVKMKYKWYRIP